MDCPNCKTWNPDDKEVCWRCQTELPRPKPPKKSRQGGFGNRTWILIAVLFAATILVQCVFMPNLLPAQ